MVVLSQRDGQRQHILPENVLGGRHLQVVVWSQPKEYGDCLTIHYFRWDTWFLRLVQTIFRPQKAHVRCNTCGLTRHELDAVHCKHCGDVINIETEGA